MTKEIRINTSSEETRIAILEDGNLVELYTERPENERMVGDIYKGRVENVVSAVQAAFVNIGLPLNGFLPFSEIGTQSAEFIAFSEKVSEDEEGQPRRPQRPQRPHRSQHVRPGQELPVQITKEPIGSKGARLTTAISLPGRFLVLVPGDQSIGVSRKISDVRERRRLRMLAKSIQPEGCGLIMRTVAVGKDAQALQADLESLLKTWKRIEEKARDGKAPMLLYKDMGMTSSIIRDLFSPDISRLIVDSRRLYQEIRKYLQEVSPNLLSRLELYKDKTPLFDTYHIENQIEKSISRKIWMKSGGYIVFDHTEAMIVIDVNSGRSIAHKDHEINALKTNLEAAKEIARQLRLRDMGGIIVIDFIDLRDDKHRKQVVTEIRKELKKDRAAFDILPMSDYGLVQLTRERIRPSLLFRYSEPCPRCGGIGRIPVKSAVLTQIERRIKQMKTDKGMRRFTLRAHPDVVEYLSQGFNSRVRQLMFKHLVVIKLVPDDTLRDENFQLLEWDKDGKEK